MHTNQRIVVWDPNSRFPEGFILTEPQSLDLARRAELSRGLVSLPWDPEIATLGVVGGFAKRAFGNGVQFVGSDQRQGCPILVAVSQMSRCIHWAARLSQVDNHPRGLLRLSPYTNNVTAVACSAVPVEGPIDLAELGPLDQHGGWTVKGTASISCIQPGYVGLGLRGNATNLRVFWFAASVI